MSRDCVKLNLVPEDQKKELGCARLVALSKPARFTELQDAARGLFSENNVWFSFVDEEGDRVAVSSQNDLDSALSHLAPDKQLCLITSFLEPTVPLKRKGPDTRSDPKPQGRPFKALYTFRGEQPGDLAFEKGDIIYVQNSDGSWWEGSCNGRVGMLPSNYVAPL